MLLPFILLYSLIISYFCSVVIYRLCITRKYYNFFFAVLLYVASGISSLWLGFLFCPLFVWYFWRKKLKFLKITLIASISIMCLSFWQAELPQRIVFESLIEAKVILSDRDYVVLEDKNNFGRTDNIAEGKWESYDDLFGIIRFSKKDFYACDTIDCKGKKKKIGEIHSSSISESTLHCALKLGGGCGLINASKSDSYSLLEYLKQNQNKQINKQGENNVTK